MLGIIFIAILVGCFGAGVYLIATSRRRLAKGPRCGNCGYNLTGSPSNRCPECGRLFIEAGVHVGSTAQSSGRRAVGYVLVLASLFLFGLGAVPALLYLRAAEQQARAAQQRAIAAQKLLSVQQSISNKPSATSAPAVDGDPPGASSQ